MKKIIHAQKESSPAFSSPAWLLLGLINSIPGRLKLRDEQLSYVLFNSGTLGSNALSSLEKKLEVPGLADHLSKQKTIPIFKVPVSKIQAIHFPFYYFSAGMHIKIEDKKYRLSFIRPNNTHIHAKSMAGVHDIPASVNIGKEWKKLLLPK